MKPLYTTVLALALSLQLHAEEKTNSKETATFGAGCFWCVEAVFEQTEGVLDVLSGYQGGATPNPTYRQIGTGKTGHAEVVKITFNPDKVSYESLLDLFFKSHDPTTMNRQGADRGTQYRSVIFYHSNEQKKAAETSKKKWDASGKFSDPIVTKITKASPFFPAEPYHQNYFQSNPYAPYSFYIRKKLKKLDLK